MLLRVDSSGYLKDLRYDFCEALPHWSSFCHWDNSHSEIWFLHWIIGLSKFAGLDTLERPALLPGPGIPRRPDHLGTWITKRPFFLFPCFVNCSTMAVT